MNVDHPSPALDPRTAPPPPNEPAAAAPFDFAPWLDALGAHWGWIVGSALLALGLSLAGAVAVLRPSYSVAVQLSRLEPPLASDAYKPQRLTSSALFGMISSPAALQQTRAALPAPVPSPDELRSRVQLSEERQTELITIAATGPTAEQAVDLANRFARGAVRFTQTLQQDEAVEAGRLVAIQLANSESDRTRIRQLLAEIETLRVSTRRNEQALQAVARAPSSTNVGQAALGRLGEKLQAARDTLADLQARFTEAHPLVREQQARIVALETQLRSAVGPTPAPGSTAADLAAAALLSDPPGAVSADESTGYDALALSLAALERTHSEVVARARAIQLFITEPPGYLRLRQPAQLEDVAAHHNRLGIAVLSLLGASVGALLAFTVICLRELLDDHLKSAGDVARVTGLPVLATLGNLDTMSTERQIDWAFRTWTALQRRLSFSANRGLVCGFTSSGPGEGRSRWIELLAGSARHCGFTVLTISSSPGALADAAPPTPSRDAGTTGPAPTATPEFNALVLTTPSDILAKLSAPGFTSTSASLPLPGGWIWNLDRRTQWQRALNSWRAIDNIVIFVELPPVSDPETVLLAENMPNVIWLADCHKALASATIGQLETLRNARCRLVGAVLNHAPASCAQRRFARWFGARSAVALAAFGLAGQPATAQSAPPSALAAPPSAANSSPRPEWQRHLTLGPGDLLDLHVYGQPELSQTQVPVGPDGRISYLEAQHLRAAGLTVDEFRAALNRELAQFRSAPEVIVIPAEYRSMKYYMLGAVVKKGAFPLHRPLTIVEAVAAANGLETGFSDRSLIILADLSRSFLARRGQHLPVDFAKLFLEGDLTQNIALEPEDYLYFPLGERPQIFVLGEVRYPGPLAYRAATGTLAAIAVRGGFTPRAWPTRLLVIRGSMERPQTFVVNANDVLRARANDFALQPRDIVYVSSRPWISAEDLLDEAATAFTQAAVITATGLHAYPLVR